MLKLSIISMLAICYLLLSSCTTETPPLPEPFTPDQVPVAVIDANSSDFEVARRFSWDIHLDGQLELVANYFLDDNGRYTPDRGRYQAMFWGQAYYNARLFNEAMCSRPSCDTTAWITSGPTHGWEVTGVWNKTGELPLNRHLNWRFINQSRDQAYQVVMTETPSQTFITQLPEKLSSLTDNLIGIRKANELDSIYLTLVFIPTSRFTANPTTNTLFQITKYPYTPLNNQFILSAEDVQKTISNTWSSEPDSVFVNVVTVKRIFKLIEGKKIAITYHINNLHPVMLD